MKTEQELRAGYSAWQRIIQIARGALRLNRPHVIDQDVAVHVDSLDGGSEAPHRLLRNRNERAKMTAEIHAETVAARRRAAGVALYPLHAVPAYVGEWREWTAAKRRDVAGAFPSALDGVDRNGLIMLGIAREQVRARLAKAPASELLQTYDAAQVRRGDPIAYLETELIEALVEHGIQPASDTDRPTLKQLRALISEQQDMRLPADLPDYESLAVDVDRLGARARAAEVAAINPQHQPEASAYYKSQEAELLAAGAASDRDDIEAVRQAQGREFAAAAGE